MVHSCYSSCVNEESVSIVIAARNEAGNIPRIFQEIPEFGDKTEIIVVEGNSTDNTWGVLQEIAESKADVKCMQQDGKGKADAVWKGIAAAQGDIIMIYDADMTVDTQVLTQCYEKISRTDASFISCSRMRKKREKGAMRFCNTIGNHFFASIWSMLLHKRITDTLCGTKVFYRKNAMQFANEHADFVKQDPYADFSFLLMAALYKLPIHEIEVQYKARTYGKPNIQRWRDGVRLLLLTTKAAFRILHT